MADENAKSQADQVADTLSQLKEMHHYAKNNVERLTAIWLLFDGELSKLRQAEGIEALMTRQGELHDALEQEIAALEALAQTLQPPPEEGEDAPPVLPAPRNGTTIGVGAPASAAGPAPQTQTP